MSSMPSSSQAQFHRTRLKHLHLEIFTKNSSSPFCDEHPLYLQPPDRGIGCVHRSAGGQVPQSNQVVPRAC